MLLRRPDLTIICSASLNCVTQRFVSYWRRLFSPCFHMHLGWSDYKMSALRQGENAPIVSLPCSEIGFRGRHLWPHSFNSENTYVAFTLCPIRQPNRLPAMATIKSALQKPHRLQLISLLFKLLDLFIECTEFQTVQSCCYCCSTWVIQLSSHCLVTQQTLLPYT